MVPATSKAVFPPAGYWWICLGVALAARLAWVWVPDFEIDAIQYSIIWCRQPFNFLIFNLIPNDVHPPANFMVSWATLRLLGPGEAAMAMPSVLSGVGTVALIWAWARQAGRPRMGLAAAALVSLCLFSIYWSQHARMYAMFMFCAMGLFWMVDAVRPQAPLRVFVLLGLFLLGAVGNHIFGLVPALAVVTVAIARAVQTFRRGDPEEARVYSVRLFYAIALPAVLLWPWYGNILFQLDLQGSTTYGLSTGHRSTMPIDGTLFKLIFGTYGFGTGWRLVLFSLLMAMGIASEILARRWAALAYAFLCLAIPFSMMAVIPFAHGFDPTYTSFIAPILWIWAGGGIALMAEWLGRWMTAFRAPGGVLALAMALALAVYARPLGLLYKMGGRPTSYRNIVAKIEQVAPKGQILVMENPFDLRLIPQFYGPAKQLYFVHLEIRPDETRKTTLLRYFQEYPKAWLLRGAKLETDPSWAYPYFSRKIIFRNESHEKLFAMGLFPRPSLVPDPWELYIGFKGEPPSKGTAPQKPPS